MLKYCPLYSGSSGNAAVLSSLESCILIDAGLSGKTIISGLEYAGVLPQSIKGIVITHEHLDHVKGAGIMSRKFDIPIYANAATWDAMQKSLGNISLANVRVFDTGEDFFINDINVLPFSVSHDAVEPVGYTFTHKGNVFSQVTDTGCITKKIYSHIEKAQLLLIESNHDVKMLKNGCYPQHLKQRVLSNKGHLSNETAALLCAELLKANAPKIILGHLSQENNTEKLALSTVEKELKKQGCCDYDIYIAKRDKPLAVFSID